MDHINQTKWYLEPRGTHTNSSLFEFLTRLGINYNAESNPLKDGHNKPHSLASVDTYAQVKLVLQSFGDSGIEFLVFLKPKGHKRIGLWVPRHALPANKLASYKRLAQKKEN